MIISFKDTIKFIGISLICCCAVFICTMFLNFYLDLTQLEDKIMGGPMLEFYNAQVSGSQMVVAITGGCLLFTTIVMLFFYIKHYIDVHKKELGILKAIGYSRKSIACHFWVFGSSVFLGTFLGFCSAYLIMPLFYATQNKDHVLPEVSIHFHFSLLIGLVIIPTLLFALLSIIYAYFKLKYSSIELLKETSIISFQKKSVKIKNKNDTFIQELQKNILKGQKTLTFFIVFASFCFSSLTQMAMSMEELSSALMGIIVFVIGMILSSVTLFLSLTTVVNGNRKTIALMHSIGYSFKECYQAILTGYRFVAYVGFVIGTIYQYALIRTMIYIFYKDIMGDLKYSFDWQALLISFVMFVLIYEMIMYVYFNKMKKISIKEIMIE